MRHSSSALCPEGLKRRHTLRAMHTFEANSMLVPLNGFIRPSNAPESAAAEGIDLGNTGLHLPGDGKGLRGLSRRQCRLALSDVANVKSPDLSTCRNDDSCSNTNHVNPTLQIGKVQLSCFHDRVLSLVVRVITREKDLVASPGLLVLWLFLKIIPYGHFTNPSGP